MLSLIASEFFAQSPVLFFPVLGMGALMTAFCLVTIRTAITRKDLMTELAHMPLRDEE